MNNQLRTPHALGNFRHGYPTSTFLQFLAVVILLFAMGCAAPKRAALDFSPHFASQSIDRVTLLPAVDARWDKTINNDYSKMATKYAARAFKTRKYKINVAQQELNAEELLRTNDLATLDWGILPHAKLPSDRWILLLTVEHVTRFVTAGTEVMTEVRGALLDTHSRSVVWRGVGKGNFLAGILMSGLVDNTALELAILNLAQSLPRKGDNPALYSADANPKLTPPRVTLPSVEIGRTRREDIEKLFEKEGRVHKYPEGETWIYHENMAVGFVPGSRFFYKPDLSVFHFDQDGVLRKYHIGSFEGKGE